MIVALALIGAVSGHNGNSGSSRSGNARSTPASVPVTGRVSGEFQDTAGCLGCGDLIRYIRADRVWCGWQGKDVIVHARFRNSSVEHLTIDWHPSYIIEGGGSHGGGMTSVQSSGIDAGATRGLFIKQNPNGVATGSPISECDPAFSTVSSG